MPVFLSGSLLARTTTWLRILPPGLKAGHLLTLANSRYVLVEPPHHVAPARIEDFFFDLLLAGYIPILTHPERLSWIESKYDVIKRLAARGVWMQVTCGSLRGSFGRRVRYWSERLLGDGIVHILATDAHNTSTRRPDLLEGRWEAERHVGKEEAQRLVLTRPSAVMSKLTPSEMADLERDKPMRGSRRDDSFAPTFAGGGGSGLARRVRHLFSR